MELLILGIMYLGVSKCIDSQLSHVKSFLNALSYQGL